MSLLQYFSVKKGTTDNDLLMMAEDVQLMINSVRTVLSTSLTTSVDTAMEQSHLVCEALGIAGAVQAEIIRHMAAAEQKGKKAA